MGVSRFTDIRSVPVPVHFLQVILHLSVDIHAEAADINGPLANLKDDYQDEAEVEREEEEEEEDVEGTKSSVKPHRGIGKNNLFKRQWRRNKKNLRKKNKV